MRIFTNSLPRTWVRAGAKTSRDSEKGGGEMTKVSELPLYLRAHTRLRVAAPERRTRRPRKRRDLPRYTLLLSCQNQADLGGTRVIGSYQVMDGWKTISCGVICSD